MIIRWLVSGGGSDNSYQTWSVNFEGGTAARLRSLSPQSLVNMSYWNLHLFYIANSVGFLQFSQPRNHARVYSIANIQPL